MTLPIELDGPRHEPAAGEVRQLLVLLHGLGADGNDLIGLAPVLEPLLPGTAFVSPHAPFDCDMAPIGRQWFSLQQREPQSLYMGAEGARGVLDRFLDRELERLGLDDDRLGLLGFSQGCMIALHTALRRSRACAGVVGFSGLLIGAERLSTDLRARPPVLLVHGDSDDIVPFECLQAAEKALRRVDVPVEAHARPNLGHGIDQQGLAIAARFLREVFAV